MRDATLERCPNHPHGGCSLARHGTCARKNPRGTRTARWYCPESHTTFSRLPDCLAARLPGELDTVEAVVAHAEQAPSLAAAANELRRDTVELAGAMRWVERRVRLVHHVLSIVIGLLPESLVRCIAEMGAVRTRLETDTALRTLRTLAAELLPVLPAPLGSTPTASARRIASQRARGGLTRRRRLRSVSSPGPMRPTDEDCTDERPRRGAAQRRGAVPLRCCGDGYVAVIQFPIIS